MISDEELEALRKSTSVYVGVMQGAFSILFEENRRLKSEIEKLKGEKP